MPLDTTVGGASANSYASLIEAQAYIDSHYVPSTVKSLWTAAGAPVQEEVLLRATQLLDRHVSWRGKIFGDVQSLSWPRACASDRYGRDIESSVIPAFLKEFQIETALWLLQQSGAVPEIGNAEFDSIRVGSLEIDFNQDGGARRSLLPESVIAALAPMGRYAADSVGGVKSVPLVRA